DDLASRTTPGRISYFASTYRRFFASGSSYEILAPPGRFCTAVLRTGGGAAPLASTGPWTSVSLQPAITADRITISEKVPAILNHLSMLMSFFGFQSDYQPGF